MSASPARDRLAFREKVVVGIGGLPVFFGGYAVKAMAIPVYQMILGVNPVWLGLVVALPRLWEAFIDPWVGHVSDNCRSRFGRRRPFILIGAVTATVAYGMIWMARPGWGETPKLMWLLGTSILFYTCQTIFAVPYQSLTFEMTPDYDERTSVMGHYSFWWKIGSLAFDWIFPLSQLAIFASPLTGIRASNWTAAAIMMGLGGLLPAWFGRERHFHLAAVQPREPFWPALRAALADRALLILIALTMIKLAASMFGGSLDYYLLVYYMHQGNIAAGSYWKGILSSGYAIVGFGVIPLLNLSCRRWERETIMMVYALTVVAGIGKWLIFRPGVGWWLLLDPLLSGPILATLNMVVPSMVADVCDEDELRCGLRREGMFGAVFLWVQKTGVAFAFLGTGIALSLSGFDVKLGGAQSPHTIFWIRLVLAGVTSVTALVGIFVALAYPITRKTAAATRQSLEARRGAW